MGAFELSTELFSVPCFAILSILALMYMAIMVTSVLVLMLLVVRFFISFLGVDIQGTMRMLYGVALFFAFVSLVLIHNELYHSADVFVFCILTAFAGTCVVDPCETAVAELLETR